MTRKLPKSKNLSKTAAFACQEIYPVARVQKWLEDHKDDRTHKDFDAMMRINEHFTSADGVLRISYFASLKSPKGRAFSQVGYQRLSHNTRVELAADIYIVDDLINAHPCIMHSLFIANALPCPQLTRYVTERKTVFKEITQEFKAFSEREVKGFFLIIIYRGSYKAFSGDVEIPFLTAFQEEMRRNCPELLAMHASYRKILKDCDAREMARRAREPEERNKDPVSSAISYICGMYESKILQAKRTICEERWGVLPGPYLFDGDMRKECLQIEWNAVYDYIREQTKCPEIKCGFPHPAAQPIRFLTEPLHPKPEAKNPGPTTCPADRHVVLFELEGTLGSYRKCGKKFHVRPGAWALFEQLKERGFLIGIFTTKSYGNVNIPDIQRSIGGEDFKFDVICCGEMCYPPKLAFLHAYKLQKKWKVKALDKMNIPMDHLLLIDCKEHTVMTHHETRVVQIPPWCTYEPDDGVLRNLMPPILDRFQSEEPPSQRPRPLEEEEMRPEYEDMRPFFADLSTRLRFDPEGIKQVVATEMNKRYVWIASKGSPTILEQRGQVWWGRTLHQMQEQFIGCPVTIDGKECNPVDIWAKHPLQRRFGAYDFFPPCSTVPAKPVPRGYFNTYVGMKITRQMAQRECDRAGGMDVVNVIIDCLKKHVLEIIANGDEDTYKWLVSWLADIVQNPGRKRIVVPCFVGGQGAGKDLFFHHIAEILGDYFLEVGDLNDITGNFQPDEMRTNLLIYLNECTFRGDRAQASKLKHTITNDKKRKHGQKFMNDVYLKNTSSFGMSGNEGNICHMESTNRRYNPIHVNDRWAIGAQDDEAERHFDELYSVPAWAWAQFLYTWDLSNFNPRKFQVSEFAEELKQTNADAHIQWFIKLAKDNTITLRHNDGKLEERPVSQQCFARDAFHNAYIHWRNTYRIELQHVASNAGEHEFWAAFRSVFRVIDNKRASVPDPTTGVRPHYLQMPSAEQMQERVAEYFKSKAHRFFRREPAPMPAAPVAPVMPVPMEEDPYIIFQN